MLIKAVLFDLDGTLVVSVDLHAQAWMDASGKLVAASLRDAAQIGKGGDQLLSVSKRAEDFTCHRQKFQGSGHLIPCQGRRS
jgi:beta-phosphoglucomutase-like phosphatase (HAD superfamily)